MQLSCFAVKQRGILSIGKVNVLCFMFYGPSPSSSCCFYHRFSPQSTFELLDLGSGIYLARTAHTSIFRKPTKITPAGGESPNFEIHFYFLCISINLNLNYLDVVFYTLLSWTPIQNYTMTLLWRKTSILVPFIMEVPFPGICNRKLRRQRMWLILTLALFS